MSAVTDLLHNTAILLSVVVIFDLATSRLRFRGRPVREFLMGVVLGLLAVGVIMASYRLEPGVVFDTRSVLLSVSGLFFGTLPTVVAMVIAGAYRLWEGGVAAYAGVMVIFATGTLGIVWRKARRGRLEQLTWREAYLFGVVVHVLMLLIMLTLPWEVAKRVLMAIGLPVLLLYPVATAVLGLLFADRLQREAVHRRLAESEANLRSLFDALAEPTVLVDAEGVIQVANLGFAKRMGRAVGECEGEGLYGLLTEQKARVCRARVEEVRQRGVLLEHEDQEEGLRFRRSFYPVRDEGGGVGRVVVRSEDVTERRLAEGQIRQLSRVVEQCPVSILITDVNGVIQYANPRLEELTGYTLAELRGKNPRVFKGEGTAPSVYAAMWRTILSGKVWRGEMRNRKKSGELFWEAASISPVLDSGGRITHFAAIKEDVTSRKMMEEQLRQKQKLESIGQLAGGVAHDFNNILAAIILHVDLMEQGLGVEEEMRQGLAEVRTSAKRAAALTRQLLMFSRRSVMEVKVLDLNETVGNLLSMLKRLIGEHIELTFEAGEGLPAVEADPGMMDQVIMNLALNARDAMSGGGRLTIGTSRVAVGGGGEQEREGVYLCLLVRDTGCGMDEATMARLFEPFFTTKEVGQGTGLGLATVHGIVVQHNGWVQVESEVGVGSTFRVYLPEYVGRERASARVDRGQCESGEGTILLAEDDAGVRRTVATSLERLGYCVLQAVDGMEAMEVLERRGGEVELLLTDIVMPGGLSGLELARRWRLRYPSVAVILTTGYSSEVHGLEEALQEGMVFLQKPYEIEQLGDAVRASLQQRRAWAHTQRG